MDVESGSNRPESPAQSESKGQLGKMAARHHDFEENNKHRAQLQAMRDPASTTSQQQQQQARSSIDDLSSMFWGSDASAPTLGAGTVGSILPPASIFFGGADSEPVAADPEPAAAAPEPARRASDTREMLL